jgi:selenocysteine-specific elongation factor
MVVAADDGVMPQTREHATVLAALGVEHGVVAITKADVADPARAAAEAAELLPGVPALPVASTTGAGLGALRDALEALPLAARPEAGSLRLHVDRAFTVHGAGTVVTGTLWSGSVARGDTVSIEPAGLRARVRAVQVHDQPLERAGPGQRVALNLAGVSLEEVGRGAVIVAGADAPAPTYRLDAALEWGAQRPDSGARVGVHHGTRETAARLVSLGGRFAQLRLEQPLVPARGDRVVIRSLAPPDTLGGGVVLDPAPRRHGPSRDVLARLARLERGEPEPDVVAGPSPPAPRPPVADVSSATAVATEEELLAAGLQPPPDSEFDAADLAALRAAGRIVRVTRTMHLHVEALARLRETVVRLIESEGPLTLGRLRDELDTSRKYAQAFLEHLDSERLTRRVGDERVLRGR